MKVFFYLLIAVPFLAWGIAITVKEIRFDQQCEGHLENAAHSSQIPQALSEMEIAMSYLKANGMTDGYTSVFYNTQDENVGFWYENLKSATDELRRESVNRNITPLEQSNVLLKLDNTIKTTRGGIKMPSGISIFPHVGLYCLWGWIGAAGFSVSVLRLLIWIDFN